SSPACSPTRPTQRPAPARNSAASVFHPSWTPSSSFASSIPARRSADRFSSLNPAARGTPIAASPILLLTTGSNSPTISAPHPHGHAKPITKAVNDEPRAQSRPTYQELEKRLAASEPIVDALKAREVDAVVGGEKIAFLLLKEVREALVNSEAGFRAMFELSGVGMFQADSPAFRFTRVNQKF